MAKFFPYYADKAAAETAADYPTSNIDLPEFLRRSSDHDEFTEAFTVPTSPHKICGPVPLPTEEITVTVGGNPRVAVSGTTAASGQVAVDRATGVWTFHSSDSGGSASVTITPQETIIPANWLHYLHANVDVTQDEATTNASAIDALEAAQVTGPESSTDGNVVSFDGTGGDTLQDSGVATGDVVTAAAVVADGNLPQGDGNKGLSDSSVVAANVTTTTDTLTAGNILIGDGTKTIAISATALSAVLVDSDVGSTVAAFSHQHTLSDISDAGDICGQNANSVNIDGGAIDGTTVGATTASTGAFTTLSTTSTTTFGDGFSSEGNSSVTGTLSCSDTLTVSSGGADITGDLDVTITSGTLEFFTAGGNTAMFIVADGNYGRYQVMTFNDNGDGGGLWFLTGRGTESSRAAAQDGDECARLNFALHNGSGWGFSGRMFYVATENQTTSARGGKYVFQATANGSTSLQDVFEILGNGNLVQPNPSAPASASATGTAGEIAWDSSYLYICTATDTWRRIAHATW